MRHIVRRTAAVSLAVALVGLASPLAWADEVPPPIAVESPTPTPPVDPTPVPQPTPTPDCRAAADHRSAWAKRHAFTVCGLPLISKAHRVSSHYRPKLVTVKVRHTAPVRLQRNAATAVVQLVAAANRAGYTLAVRSAYRSFTVQKAAYRNDRVLTAPAGASEHQSGLAVDLVVIKHGHAVRGYPFGRTAAGRWVARHAAGFGLIVRYPNGKQKITGIPYEPWHLRFVGKAAAAGVVATPSKTLEEYLRER